MTRKKYPYSKRKRNPKGPVPTRQEYNDWYFSRRKLYGEVMPPESFIRIWTESGKWELRGTYKGAYRMYRLDKTVGYIEENVIIEQAPKYRKNRK